MKLGVLLLCMFLSAPSFSTTWVESKVKDPMRKWGKCKVSEPASSGSYIYNWPSKYDQVFWPLTAESGIWYCRKSGFTAFLGDFEEITKAEKKVISKYLKLNRKGSGDLSHQLKLLEGVYALRDTDEQFDNRLLRVLARRYQDLGEFEKANEYRKSALEDIEKMLDGDLPEETVLEYLYVASNYARQFNMPEKSKVYVRKLNEAIKTLKNKELEGFTQYLLDLSKETPDIMPGGKLDPEKND